MGGSVSASMRRQGYAATGWRQVVAESGAPWGSQAHHFPGGKQQLAAEAVAIAGSAYERMLRAALESSHPADAVLAWADLAARQLEASGWVDGCPVATVALEEAATSDTIAAACTEALTR
jgi:TetR/AcrR family transcriptional regulator, lmrAB and yxaGH operons repressor